MKYHITGVILAGGKSTRMGFNKELITLHNKPVIHTLINTFNKMFDEVLVVSNHPSLYSDKPVTVVQDILDSKGPLIGLHTALSYANNDYVYIIACDMPSIDEEYINDTVHNIKDHSAYLYHDGTFFEPFHGFYHKKLVKPIEEFIIKSTTFTEFIMSIDAYAITDITKYNPEMFFNINTPNDLYHLEHKNDAYSDFKIKKVTDVKTKNINDYVIDEYPLIVYVNKVKYVTLLTTPKHIEELVVGYLKSEKIIEAYDDIMGLIIYEDDNKVDVIIEKEIDFESLGKDKLLVSGCGVGTKFHEALDDIIINSVDSDYTITKEDIFNAGTTLNNQSGLFKLTGGVHSCLLVDNNKNIYFEDIGRHNAVDKVIGHILINQLDPSNSYIFSSGRISSDMLLKCALSNIPIVISRSAPTSLAVSLAEKYGITLIGFARGTKFNIYTHSHRIK